jgi:hypothetical protein
VIKEKNRQRDIIVMMDIVSHQPSDNKFLGLKIFVTPTAKRRFTSLPLGLGWRKAPSISKS